MGSGVELRSRILNVFPAQACVPDHPTNRQPDRDPANLSLGLGEEDRKWMYRAGHNGLPETLPYTLNSIPCGISDWLLLLGEAQENAEPPGIGAAGLDSKIRESMLSNCHINYES